MMKKTWMKFGQSKALEVGKISLTTTGLTETLTRVNQQRKEKEINTELIEVYDDDEEIDLLNTRESSHAFD